MKKDKLSKKKGKPANPESKIKEPIKQLVTRSPIAKAFLEGLEEQNILSSPIISPFKHLSDKHNPFLQPDLIKALLNKNKKLAPYSLSPHSDIFRAELFSDLVKKVYKYSLHCKYVLMLRPSGDLEENIIKLKEDIYREKKEIVNLLEQIIPKEAKKTLAHQFIRLCKLYPQTLTAWVDTILSRIYKHRELVKKDRRWKWKDKESKREQTIKNFMENEFDELYDSFNSYFEFTGIRATRRKETLKNITPKAIKENSYPETAVRILSHIVGGGYDTLYTIYKKTKKFQDKI